MKKEELNIPGACAGIAVAIAVLSGMQAKSYADYALYIIVLYIGVKFAGYIGSVIATKAQTVSENKTVKVAAFIAAFVVAAAILLKVTDTSPIHIEPRDIKTHSISSTAISEVGYDKHDKVLIIVFKVSGEKYAYFDVPAYVYEELQEQDSIGNYFVNNIRNDYRYERLS